MSPNQIWLLLLFLATGSMQVLPQEQRSTTASIEGIVLRSGGSEPVPGARISLRSFVSTSPNSAAPVLSSTDEAVIASVLVGNDGRFILKDIPPGAYRVFASGDGYVGQEYEQPSPNRPGFPVVPEAGQALKGATFRLQETGSISGRIRNTSGQPVEGVQVQALRLGYGADGHKTLQPLRTATTNDRGEFRVYWIPPGRYLLFASRIDPPSSRPSEIARVNLSAAAYYPGGPDPSHASVISIQPGTELTSMDWPLSESRLRVSGRVFDPATGQAPKAASIVVVQRDFGAMFVDILGRTFSIQRPGTDSLHVVLSAFGGRIDGTVEDERAQPVRGVEVVLVPDRARDRIDLYQQIRTDQSGRFTLRGIPPSDYKLFAWDDIEPFAFFDPDLLRQSEPRATPVRVGESSKESVNVRLIVQ